MELHSALDVLLVELFQVSRVLHVLQMKQPLVEMLRVGRRRARPGLLLRELQVQMVVGSKLLFFWLNLDGRVPRSSFDSDLVRTHPDFPVLATSSPLLLLFSLVFCGYLGRDSSRHLRLDRGLMRRCRVGLSRERFDLEHLPSFLQQLSLICIRPALLVPTPLRSKRRAVTLLGNRDHQLQLHLDELLFQLFRHLSHLFYPILVPF